MSGQNTGIPSSAVCTDCTQAAYTVLSQGIPQLSSTVQSAVSSECGANYTGNFIGRMILLQVLTSFADGQMPSDVEKTAGNASTTNTGSAIALSFGSLNMGAIVVAAVSAAFAILA
jgi:hypothetical protein